MKSLNAVEIQTADGPDHDDEQRRQRQPGERDLRQPVREDEQPEHDEERDLREEREPFVERDELAPVRRRRAADGEADEVDGEEAAAAEDVRRAEGESAAVATDATGANAPIETGIRANAHVAAAASATPTRRPSPIWRTSRSERSASP